MNCKTCEEVIDEEERYDHVHEICYDCWVKDKINELNLDTHKRDLVLTKFLEWYFGGYEPDYMIGSEWNYDGSPRDLWADMVEIIGHEVEWN
jgi:hypothetical protein